MTQNERFCKLAKNVTLACRDRKNRAGIHAAVSALDAAVEQAVRKDYPQLCGWRVNVCMYRTKRRSLADAARLWSRNVVHVAASRISEAYGLGAGSDWLGIPFVAGQSVDSVAAGQVVKSLEAQCLPGC